MTQITRRTALRGLLGGAATLAVPGIAMAAVREPDKRIWAVGAALEPSWVSDIPSWLGGENFRPGLPLDVPLDPIPFGTAMHRAVECMIKEGREKDLQPVANRPGLFVDRMTGQIFRLDDAGKPVSGA